MGLLQDKIDLGQPLLPPPAISEGYITLGWKLVAIAALSALLFIVFRWYRIRKKNKYRRDAIALCKGVNDASESHKLLSVVKNVAMDKFGRSKTASLYGKDFSEFLNTSCRKEVFPEEMMLEAERAIFTQEDLDEKTFKNVKGACIKWIKKHHVRAIELN